MKRNATKVLLKEDPFNRFQRYIFTICLCTFLSLSVDPVTGQGLVTSANSSLGIVHVKFLPEASSLSQDELLSAALRADITRISRLFSLPENRLNEMKERGEQRTPKRLPNLNMWFKVELQSGVDIDAFIQVLKEQDNVAHAEKAPRSCGACYDVFTSYNTGFYR